MAVPLLSGTYGGAQVLEGRLGPYVPAGDQVTLPVELGNAKVRFRFEPDSESWCKLASLTHLDGASSFVFVNAPTGDLDWRLWEIRGTLEAGGTYSVAPKHAGGFTARSTVDTAGNPALLLLWSDVRVAGTTDAFQVAVLVSLAAGDQVSRWSAFVNRTASSTETCSVDEFDLGITCWAGPIATRGGESAIEAQARAYYLTPINHTDALPAFYGCNNPMRRWSEFGIGYTLNHPSGGDAAPGIYAQVLQFAALCCADSLDAASFRRVLYLGTEDTENRFKQFRHQGRTTGSAGRIEWRAIYYPSLAKLPSGVEAFPASEWGNVCRTDYPVTIGALLAPTDDLPFHAAEFYRRFVERVGLGGLPREQRTGRSTLGREGIYHGEISYLGDVAGMHDRFVELSLIVQAIVDNPHVDLPVYEMWSNWALNQINFDSTHTEPIQADPGVAPAITAAEAAGILTFLYTQIRSITRGEGWEAFLPDRGEVHGRDGAVNPTRLVPDYATAEGRALFVEHMLPQLLAATGCHGVYSDGFHGAHSAVVYDPADPEQRGHPAHGGKYWTAGKQQFARELRAALQEASGTEESPLVTEAVDEGVAEFDLSQEGYVVPGGHLLLAVDALYGYGSDGVPAAARDLSPPVWQMVYHRWHCAGRFTTCLTDVGLATNAAFYPSGIYGGMTAAEWIDWQAYWWLLTWITGNKPLFLSHWGAGPVDRPSVQLASNGALEIPDPAADPSSTGLTVAGFLRDLLSAWKLEHAGRFLVYGHMEPQLAVDYTHPEVDLATNPVAVCKAKTDPAHSQWARPAYFGGSGVVADAVLSATYSVPRVEHRVWRGPNGEVGIILANWSDTAASWAGTLDPAAYGITGEFAVRQVVTDVEDVGQLDYSVAANSGQLAGAAP